MKQAALKYARAGWHVFPVNQAGHVPYVHAWPEQATDDVATVEQWWDTWPDAEIGTIPARVGLCAVDYDTKGGSTLEELRSALARALGELPDTDMVARTPSGGEHHYYKATHPVACSNSRVVRNIDIRSADNGFIALPPTPGYSWIKLGRAAALPDSAYSVFGRLAESVEREWSIEPDLSENVQLARAWLASAECRPSVEGQGGNQALYDTACMMVSFGLSSELAIELLLDVYNVEKCDPPWDDGDIRRTVGNAYRYHTSAPGNMTPAFKRAKLGFEPVKVPVSEQTLEGTEYFRITNRDEILSLPPPTWLVSPYLQEETCAVLTGGYSTYKSFIALDMALSVVARPERSTWDAQAAGPVVFMLGEGRTGMGKRLAAWEHHHGTTIDRNDILFVDPVPHVTMHTSEMRNALVKRLLEIGDGYKMVVLDTLGRAMAGLNENGSEAAGSVSLMMAELRAGLGACILAIGHTRKDRTTGQGATRGSGILENDADTVLTAEKIGDRRVLLEVVKQKDAPEANGLELSLHPTQSSLVVQREAPKAGPTKQAPVVDVGIYSVIDEVARGVLESDPHTVWSTRNLANNVAMDARIPLGMEAVRRRLMDLSVRGEFEVSRMFLPARGQGVPKWKFSPTWRQR